MSTNHSHALPSERNEKSLWIALALTGSFLLAEVAAGIVFNSLALLSDAAHMFTDAAALAIALAAVRVARRPADAKRTYGYYRFEILAAAFNALLLFGVAGYILYEGWQRLREPAQVQSSGMLQKLLLLGLIEEGGRLELPGRPIVYKTTEAFLDYFGLESLTALPALPKVEDEEARTDGTDFLELFQQTLNKDEGEQ